MTGPCYIIYYLNPFLGILFYFIFVLYTLFIVIVIAGQKYMIKFDLYDIYIFAFFVHTVIDSLFFCFNVAL